MRNYEDIDEFFDYTNKDEWIQYLKNDIYSLWQNSYILKEYFEVLKQDFNEVNFSDIKEEDKQLLLGGVITQREEIYTKNSLSKFYKNFFGLSIEDLSSWIAQESYQEKLIDIKIIIQETEFIEFLNQVFLRLDNCITLQNLVPIPNYPKLNYEELKNEPNKVKDLITNFIQSTLDISINYNYKTFFLCSINQITRRYLEKAYPNFSQILNLMQGEFGLTEFLWNNPINNIESQIYKDYTIFCFPEYNLNNIGASFGGAICSLNELIWEYFDSARFTEILNILFRKVPNLKENYKNRVKNQLPEVFYNDVSYSKIMVRDSDKTIMEILDVNSAYLFANIKKFRVAREGNIFFEDI